MYAGIYFRDIVATKMGVDNHTHAAITVAIQEGVWHRPEEWSQS